MEGQDRGAHDARCLLAQGVHDLHGVPAGIVLGPADLVVVGGEMKEVMISS